TGYFDAVLQNEACNDSSPCDFGRHTVPPGSIAFASGWLTGTGCTPPGCGAPGTGYLVAYIGLCATTTGNAQIHWQFSPPAPANRDSEITDNSSNLVTHLTQPTQLMVNYRYDKQSTA